MSADDLYYDAEGYAITLGHERYGPVSPLRAALEATADVWLLPGLDPAPGHRWHCQHEEWLRSASKLAREALASVGRNGNRQDRETGLGPKGEHAVGEAETPKA